MKVRFEVDQAACFRKGIDCPKSIVTLEIDPGTLPQDERNLIADRLDGIDVCVLSPRKTKMHHIGSENCVARPQLIKAESPDYAALMAAVRANQAEVEFGPGSADHLRDAAGKTESFLQRWAQIQNARDEHSAKSNSQ